MQKIRYILCYMPPSYNLALTENMIRTFGNFVVDRLNYVILGNLNLPSKLFLLSCTKYLITTSFETCLSTLVCFT